MRLNIFPLFTQRSHHLHLLVILLFSLLKLFYKLLGKTMIMIGKYFIMLSPHDLIVYVSSLLITMDNKYLGLCSCDIHQYVTGTVQSLNV